MIMYAVFVGGCFLDVSRHLLMPLTVFSSGPNQSQRPPCGTRHRKTQRLGRHGKTICHGRPNWIRCFFYQWCDTEKGTVAGTSTALFVLGIAACWILESYSWKTQQEQCEEHCRVTKSNWLMVRREIHL